jgi:hypothetical protein
MFNFTINFLEVRPLQNPAGCLKPRTRQFSAPCGSLTASSCSAAAGQLRIHEPATSVERVLGAASPAAAASQPVVDQVHAARPLPIQRPEFGLGAAPGKLCNM